MPAQAGIQRESPQVLREHRYFVYIMARSTPA
jgi:hypothetical protein